jgi:hypothetical protein
VPKVKQIEILGLDATLRGISLDMGLTIDELVVTSGSAQVSVDPPGLSLQQPGKATVVVGEASVQSLLEKQAPAGKNSFVISISNGLVKVTAKARIVVELSITAHCRLVIREGNQLHVELQAVDLGGTPAKRLLETQLNKINPLVDGKDLPIQIEMNQVTALDGKITIHGKIKGVTL